MWPTPPSAEVRMKLIETISGGFAPAVGTEVYFHPMRPIVGYGDVGIRLEPFTATVGEEGSLLTSSGDPVEIYPTQWRVEIPSYGVWTLINPSAETELDLSDFMWRKNELA